MTPPKLSARQLGMLVLGLVVLGVLAYVVLRREKNEPLAPNNIAISTTNSKGQHQESPSGATTFTPLGAVERVGQKILSFITDAQKNSETEQIFKGAPSAQETSDQQKEREARVFEIMFPEPVIAAYRENQAILVSVGVLDAKEVNPLTNTTEAERYIRNRFETYINNPQVSVNEKMVAIRALAHLPYIMSYERARAERILRGASTDRIPSKLTSFLALSIPVAQAEWKTTDPCYKDDNPKSKVQGYNNISTCCNCGEYCSYGCKYYDDCGENSTKCNVPQGCLNLDCKMYQNALWDRNTGTCGCG